MAGEQIPSCHHSDRKKEKTEEIAKEIKKQSQKKHRLARSCRQRRLSLGGQFGIGAYQGGGALLWSGFSPPLDHIPWGAEAEWASPSSSDWRSSSTATKRSPGNAYSHVCSDSSGSKQKMFMPTSAKKCDAKVLPTNSTTPKSVNPNVTSWINSYHFGGKIKHAYETCQADKSGLLKTCQHDVNMTGVTGKQTCQTITKARKQNL